MRKVFQPNKNLCTSCGKRRLPEPIVFAQMSRLTSEYVCSECYFDHSRTMIHASVDREIAQAKRRES